MVFDYRYVRSLEDERLRRIFEEICTENPIRLDGWGNDEIVFYETVHASSHRDLRIETHKPSFIEHYGNRLHLVAHGKVFVLKDGGYLEAILEDSSGVKMNGNAFLTISRKLGVEVYNHNGEVRKDGVVQEVDSNGRRFSSPDRTRGLVMVNLEQGVLDFTYDQNAGLYKPASNNN